MGFSPKNITYTNSSEAANSVSCGRTESSTSQVFHIEEEEKRSSESPTVNEVLQGGKLKNFFDSIGRSVVLPAADSEEN